MKKLLISSALIAGFIFTGCQNNTTNNNKPVTVNGIRTAPLTADSQNLPTLQYNDQLPMPGKVKTQPAAFNGAPPMIPHSVDGMVPITKNKNQCILCHSGSNPNITPMPKDHYVDNFEGDKSKPVVAGSRYNCTLCHAPQAQVDPVKENLFESYKNKKK
jgi:cytochrome c-type protein NapB